MKLPSPTSRCYLLGMASLFGLLMGCFYDDESAVFLSITCLIIIGLSYLISFFTVKHINIRRDVPDGVFAGEEFGVKYTISNTCPFFNVYDICLEDDLLNERSATGYVQATQRILHLEEVNSKEENTLLTKAKIKQRGIYSGSNCTLSSTFPFNLFKTSKIEILNDDVTVYPSPIKKRRFKRLYSSGHDSEEYQSRTGKNDSGEFNGLREFEYGDSVKCVNWPLSAKYQELVVKDFNSVLVEDVVILFHSYAGRGNQSKSTEYILKVLSGMFSQLYDDGVNFFFYASFNNWNPITVTQNNLDLDIVLSNLASADVQPDHDLNKLNEIMQSNEIQHKKVVVLSNSPLNNWKHLIRYHKHAICLDLRLKISLKKFLL